MNLVYLDGKKEPYTTKDLPLKRTASNFACHLLG